MYVYYVYICFNTDIYIYCLVLEQSGDQMEVKTSENSSVRFLLAAAKPLNEPVRSSLSSRLLIISKVARYGPFVMNTREEIMQAFQDFQSGKLQQ